MKLLMLQEARGIKEGYMYIQKQEDKNRTVSAYLINVRYEKMETIQSYIM